MPVRSGLWFAADSPPRIGTGLLPDHPAVDVEDLICTSVAE